MSDRPTPSSQALADFARDGFVQLESYLNSAALGKLLENVDRFIRDVVPTLPTEHVFYEDKRIPSTLKQIQRLGEYDTWFNNLFTSSSFRETAEVFLNGPVVPKNVQYFNKPPLSSQPTPPHQDGHYFMLSPCEAVTMWLALDSVDEENGCVRYIPGSHRNGMRQHARTQTLGFSQGIVDFPTSSDVEHEVTVPAQPGDLLVHHAMTVHRADANKSPKRPRRALGFVYYSHRARENEAAHAAYQQELTRDLKEQGRL